MECLVIGLGTFGRAIARNLKQQDINVVGIDYNEKALQGVEEYLEEAIKLDASIESNLRHIGVEHFHHCFICIGKNVEASLTIALHLIHLGVTKIIARSSSYEHGLLLQKIGSIDIVYPEMDIAKQVVKETITEIQNYIRLRDDMVIITIPVPLLMIHKSLEELSLTHKYRIQILWLDKVTPYVDGEGEEGVYEESVNFIPPNYRFNEFDRISIFGSINNIHLFTQSMSNSEELSDNIKDSIEDNYETK